MHLKYAYREKCLQSVSKWKRCQVAVSKSFVYCVYCTCKTTRRAVDNVLTLANTFFKYWQRLYFPPCQASLCWEYSYSYCYTSSIANFDTPPRPRVFLHSSAQQHCDQLRHKSPDRLLPLPVNSIAKVPFRPKVW